MKRRETPRVEGAASGAAHAASVETKLLHELPLFVQHLTCTRYEDGSPRKPGTALVKVIGSTWVVVLKEPDTALEMSCAGVTIDDACALAEILLGDPAAPWEPDPWAEKRLTGKRPK